MPSRAFEVSAVPTNGDYLSGMGSSRTWHGRP